MSVVFLLAFYFQGWGLNQSIEIFVDKDYIFNVRQSQSLLLIDQCIQMMIH